MNDFPFLESMQTLRKRPSLKPFSTKNTWWGGDLLPTIPVLLGPQFSAVYCYFNNSAAAFTLKGLRGSAEPNRRLLRLQRRERRGNHTIYSTLHVHSLWEWEAARGGEGLRNNSH